MKESLPIERGPMAPPPEKIRATPKKEKTQEINQETEIKSQNYWTMNKLLEMFGTEKARTNFLDVCYRYHDKLREQKFSSIKGYSESEKGRAALHNQIMETIKRLSFAQKPGTEEEKLLFSLANRDKVTEMIGDYIEITTSLKHPKLTKLGQMRLGKFH